MPIANKKRLDSKVLNYIILGGTLLVVIPFLLAAFYNHPLGMHEWDWITHNGKFFADESTFIEIQVNAYLFVMGRYCSTFLSAMTPYWYTLSLFQFYFACNIVLILLALATLYKTILNTNTLESIAIPCLIFCMWLSSISDVYDSLYMLTSIQTYHSGFFFWVILLILWLKIQRYKKNIFLCLVFFISFLGIGTNEVSLMYMTLLNLGMIWHHRRFLGSRHAVCLLVLIGVSCLVPLLAPGNFERSNSIKVDQSIASLAIITLATTVYNTISLLVNGHVFIGSILCLLLAPRLKMISEISYKMIGVYLIGTLFIAQALLIFSTKGTSLAERVIDLISLHSIVLYFILLLKLANSETLRSYVNGLPYVGALKIGIGVLFFMFVFASGLRIDRTLSPKTYMQRIITTSNSSNLWISLLSGELDEYDRQMKSQYIELAKCQESTCIVTKPTIRPSQLYQDKHDRRNNVNGERFMGCFFNKRIKKVAYGLN